MPPGELMLESYRQNGMALLDKWSRMPGKEIRGFEKHREVDFLKGIGESDDGTDLWRKITLARLYENAWREIQNLEEATRTLQVGSYEKYVFPLIRAVLANLVISELVTTHALDAPTGLVFYLNALYGSSKGSIVRGTNMFDARRGPACDIHYSDEIIQQETVGTGDGIISNFAGNLGYTPVRPGTVVITDGTQRIVDNGNGALQGNIGPGVNTVNYQTGAYNATFLAPAAVGTITADYEYNSEGNIATPEIDIQLTSAPVTARTRKLRARWSIEAQQDFQAYHGINAEVEIVSYMANQIAKEINYQVIAHLQQIAAAGNVVWDRTPPPGVQWILHRESFYDALIQCSNLIFQRTQRASGTWIVAAVDVCNVIEALNNFKPMGAKPTGAGIVKSGTIGDFTVYKHPCMACGSFLMGYRGTSFLDTGYIYAPYLAAFTTNTIVLDDLVARKGMMQRVGLKVVNSGMYATGTICQSGGKFTPTANPCGINDNDPCHTPA